MYLAIKSKRTLRMKIRVGGVPEHFNYPWKMAISNGVFSDIGLDVQWEDVKGGTGAMCQKLEEGDLDLAVVLTEGIVKAIANGNRSLIVQKFIKSPLIWGIHTAAHRPAEEVADWSKVTFAISRKGSGSHIMAYVEAKNRGTTLKENQFKIVDTFENARASLLAKETDILLWEKFTTSPFVKEGMLARVGETVTPWPCFVVAANKRILAHHPDQVWNLLWKLRKTCQHFMNMPNATNLIAENYGISMDKVVAWYDQTEWEQDVFISKKMLQNVGNTLKNVGVLPAAPNIEELCWDRVVVY